MQKHYHSELVRFVIESIFDERLKHDERILTSEDILSRIAEEANRRFSRHEGFVETVDVQRIYNAWHARHEAAKNKFISEHLKIDA